MRALPGNRNAAGFTLLEALAAITLMAVILAALATITAQWLPNWNRGIDRVNASERVALALERIAGDLSAAELIPAGRDIGQLIFQGTDSSVIFVRTALGPNANSSLDIVRIANADGASGSMVVRTRSFFAPINAKDAVRRQPTFSDPVVLLRPPYLVRFAYAGKDRAWQSAWPLQDELPSAIRITIRDLQRERAITTAVALPIKASVECLAAKSLKGCLTPQPNQSGPSNQPGPNEGAHSRS